MINEILTNKNNDSKNKYFGSWDSICQRRLPEVNRLQLKFHGTKRREGLTNKEFRIGFNRLSGNSIKYKY